MTCEPRFHSRIACDPRVLRGVATIRGTHIAVAEVVRARIGKASNEAVLTEFPQLTLADVQAALLYAAEVVRH